MKIVISNFDYYYFLIFTNLFEIIFLIIMKNIKLIINKYNNINIKISIHNFEFKYNNINFLKRYLLFY